MNSKNIIFIFLTLVLLLGVISSVNAAESNLTNIPDNEITQTKNTFTHFDKSSLQSQSTGSFSELNKIINSNNDSDIYLSRDYYFFVDEDSSLVNGIVINREVTIHGNGFTIDGAVLARIFQVNNKNVILKDITFLNGKTPGQSSGGAISGDCSAINCIFIHNSANINGGAMYKGTAINCTFKENYAKFNAESYASGGAMHEGTAINCIFENNTAEINGGALSLSTAINCTFISNMAKWNGGALYETRAVNCIFRDNYAKEYGGAIESGFAENCDFINNFAGFCGGATDDTNVTHCNFYNNGATYDGGAMYYGNAANCNFVDNFADVGGAMLHTNAVLCNFTGNSATTLANAMYAGIAVQCNFNKNDIYDVKIDNSPIFTAYNFTSTYNSGEKLLFYVKSGDEELVCIETVIKIYQQGNWVENAYVLTGDGWTVDLEPGIYNAVLSVDGLAGVKHVNVILNISKSPTVISATNFTTSYKKDDYLIATLKNNFGKAIAKTYVNVNFGEFKHQYVTDEKGQIMMPTNNLNPNTYNVTISFDGNSMYLKSNVTTQVTVTKSRTLIDWQHTNSSDNINYDLIVILKDYEGNYLSNEIISVDLLGTENYTTDENGQIILYSKDLPAGIFPVHIKFSENEYYIESSISTIFAVDLIPTVISGNNFTTYYNNNDNFTVALTDYQRNPLGNCTVIVDFGGIKNYTTNENGQFEISSASLIPGTYFANIIFNGNEKYSNSQNMTVVNVEKCPVEIDIHQVNARYNIKDDLIITLTDYYGNIINNVPIYVQFNTTENYTTDQNGQVTIPTEGYPPDTYHIVVRFNGNELYLEKNKTLNIFIFREYTKISALNLISEYNPHGYFLFNITDTLGRPLKGLVLIVDFNGTEKYVSDENGQIKIPSGGLPPNSYPLNVTFTGNEYYIESSCSYNMKINKSTTNLSASDVVTTVDEAKYLVIDLKDSYSQPVSGLEVYIDLNGVVKYITDEKGQVKISTEGLSANDYQVSIVFKGNENYNPSNITGRVIINKKYTPVAARISIVENDVTILVNVDFNAKGFVRFDISGLKNYTFFSPITDGQSMLYCTLLDGVYDVNIVYVESDYYYENSTFESFAVGKVNKNTFGDSKSDENTFGNSSDITISNEILFSENTLINQLSGDVGRKIDEINQVEKSYTNSISKSFSANASNGFNPILILILVICALCLIAFVVKKRRS